MHRPCIQKNILDGSANAFTQWTLRSLKRMNFSCRRKSLSQSIPLYWKDKALCGAERVRNRFQEENVEVVLAEDETFLKFHERSDTYIVPKGTKRIGSSGKFDEKGCTLMVTMDMLSSN